MIDERPPVVIIDYGMGNLHSVASACRAVGVPAITSSSPEVVAQSSGIILPGVGAFGEAMARLRELGLDDAVRRAVDLDVPILAVCLGMQLLLDRSLEFGEHRGLGIIPGFVSPLREPGGPRIPKVPHVGWERIHPVKTAGWGGTSLRVLDPGEYVYFVHSLHCHIDDSRLLLADAEFGDRRFCAAFGNQRLLACQFHPEKSGPAGLAVYREMFGTASRLPQEDDR